MHQCLTIPEVQSLIFNHFQPDISCEDRATLARLAWTCRAFTDTALDVLWRHLLWLAPLVQVMPDNLWTFQVARRTKILVKIYQGIGRKRLVQIRLLCTQDPRPWVLCTHLRTIS